MSIPPTSNERQIPTFPRQGAASAQWQLSSTKDDTPVTLPFSFRPVIPVVFLPGVMATNLCRLDDDETIIWEPPNTDMKGIGHAIKTLLKYLFKSSATRQAELNPDDSRVFYDGQIYPKRVGELKDPVENLHARGWGSVMRTAYHPMMEELQIRLNSAAFRGDKADPWWQENGMGRHRLPTVKGGAVTEEDITALGKYRYDVWAGGYNWLQSNVDSAIDVINWLEKELPEYYDRNDAPLLAKTSDDKIPVLLVTHSMGGLVARAINDLLQPSPSLTAEGATLATKQFISQERTIDVLGVNHIAMPAEGAPKLYTHMRSGYPGAAGIVLSRDSADFVAVSYRVQSTFELLPFKSYNDGKPWLFIAENCQSCMHTACDRNRLGGNWPKASLVLPQKDSSEEIYKATHAFGLIPDHNLHLTDPTKRKEEFDKPSLDKIRENIDINIDKAATFQDHITGRYHKETYAYWKNEGEDEDLRHTDENDKDYFASGPVVWQGPAAYPGIPESMPVSSPRNPLRDYGIGYMVQGWQADMTSGRDLRPRWKICQSFLPGDGTVDEISGAAPAKVTAGGMYPVNHKDLQKIREQICEREQKKVNSFSHQDICNDKSVQWLACHAIAKIIAKNAERIPTALRRK